MEIQNISGRNADVVDVTIDHGSASRYHAALVYHKILKRSFIIDLKSSEYCIFLAIFLNLIFRAATGDMNLASKRPRPIIGQGTNEV